MGPSLSSFCLVVHHQSALSASSCSQIKDISQPSNPSTCTTAICTQATSLLPQRQLHHHLLVDSHFGYLSLFVHAEPTTCMWHAYAPMPSSCGDGHQCPLTVPNPVCLIYTSRCGIMAMRLQQMFEGHRWQLHQRIGLEVLQESHHEDDLASHSGQPFSDGSLKVHKHKDSVGLLSLPSSQPSPRTLLHGSHNGITTSLAQISGTF